LARLKSIPQLDIQAATDKVKNEKRDSSHRYSYTVKKRFRPWCYGMIQSKNGAGMEKGMNHRFATEDHYLFAVRTLFSFFPL
jgi:hypothetical protein